ncbi:hypothetical protein L208DRAFT_1401655 [Tricholoma matsutake]|nr:hypothetical protein L208DRAFT_1401655 [Tricholoma matsutake 945]
MMSDRSVVCTLKLLNEVISTRSAVKLVLRTRSRDCQRMFRMFVLICALCVHFDFINLTLTMLGMWPISPSSRGRTSIYVLR